MSRHDLCVINTMLKGADNDDWREKQRQAARIAAEIEVCQFNFHLNAQKSKYAN